MIKTTINLEAVDFIKLIPEKEHPYIGWRGTTKRIFNWKTFSFELRRDKEGFNDCRYQPGGVKSPYLNRQDFKESYPNLILRGNTVYYKAFVRIYFKDNKTISKEFNTNDEAENYYNSLNRKLSNKTEL